MPKHRLPQVFGPQRRTNPIIWCAALICAFIATIVIIAGIVVFVGYLAIRPKMPWLSIPAARLDRVDYDQAGVLAVQLTILVRAENDNLKVDASFYDTKFILGYHGLRIAQLVTDQFEVDKNKTKVFNYVVQASPIPLPPAEQLVTQDSLEESRRMTFYLKGDTRTQWRVGPLGSLKFTLHLNCELVLPINGSVVYSNCSSKSHRS